MNGPTNEKRERERERTWTSTITTLTADRAFRQLIVSRFGVATVHYVDVLPADLHLEA